MKRSLCILCGISVAVGALAARPTSVPEPSLVAVEALNCKPSAPVRVDVTTGDLVGGRSSVDYVVTPVMDALNVEVSVIVLDGILGSHARPAPGPAFRGEVLHGSLTAEYPAAVEGAELEIRAHISIPDPDAPGGIGVHTTTRRVTWGRPDRMPDNVTPIVVDGEVTSLSVPSSRL